jgi:hypothetical protein
VVISRTKKKPRQPKEVVESAKTSLALLDRASEGSGKLRKNSKKAKEADRRSTKKIST